MDTNFIISLDSIADVNAFANTIAHFKSEIESFFWKIYRKCKIDHGNFQP